MPLENRDIYVNGIAIPNIKDSLSIYEDAYNWHMHVWRCTW